GIKLADIDTLRTYFPLICSCGSWAPQPDMGIDPTPIDYAMQKASINPLQESKTLVYTAASAVEDFGLHYDQGEIKIVPRQEQKLAKPGDIPSHTACMRGDNVTVWWLHM